MIGTRLKNERARLGWTQAELGERASAAKRTVIDWEKGVSSPTGQQLAALAQAGVDVVYVITGESRALRESLRNLKDSSIVARRAGGTDEEIARLQEAIFQGGQTDQRDVVKLLVDYRRCSRPDQKTIRQMAERLASDAPTTSSQPGKRK